MTHKTAITVRGYECDSYSHVNNAVYLNYLEHARMDFLNVHGFDYDEFIRRGYALYITHTDIFYKNGARLNDELIIETTPVMLRKVSGTYKHRILKADGHICVEAEVTWACVLQDGVKLSPIPDDLMIPALKPEA